MGFQTGVMMIGLGLAGLGLVACQIIEGDDNAILCPAELDAPCAARDRALSLVDIQTIGTHNSYKNHMPAPELALLAAQSPRQAEALDYGHDTLTAQLDAGMRQLEIDILHDPDGGRFTDPMAPRLTQGQPGARAFDPAPLQAPGFKTLHIQDFDVWSRCAVFVTCLEEVRSWSLAHPDHAPILIMMNAKQSPTGVPGSVDPLPFDAEAFRALEAEILSVFAAEHVLMPDTVRGSAQTLRAGVLSQGWPSLDEMRGRVIFLLDENEAPLQPYLAGNPSLEGRVMFVKSVAETAPHAAVFVLNNPERQFDEIQARVEAGYLVRTRADAGTREARTGDTARLEAALASGAHYISTDYYEPREEWSDYAASLPDGGVVRCNPVRQPAACAGGEVDR